ncbi:putative bifunctional diguanylate cyclase/phosphodiesterase [Paractinoplanes bogorensis]|uniref:putative bifunctional diguanylate cyclase/phosphodiesterase n=1 Tax=Paractinoplanes bogorensis TaxID=1610840 RepID=UPI0027E06D48|nr:EAL domain-containing protein [Actinoplanes bogorensis]
MLATDQLTEFLSAVADRPAGPAAHHAALECAARALNADVAVLMIDGEVVASIGLPADEVPAYTLAEVALGHRATLDLGDHRYAVTYATISGANPGVLVLGRASDPFTAEEVCLLRGMARVLELSLQSLHVIESERRFAEENGRLLGYLDHGRRVFEELGAVQRAIGRRTPVARVFDMVTAAVRDLLGVDMVAISLVDREDPTRAGVVASNGLSPELAARFQQVPVSTYGVSGLAILADELVAMPDYVSSAIALTQMTDLRLRSVMAAPVHENGQVAGCVTVGTFGSPRRWDKPVREILQSFADHLSLALTDARTQEAMSQAFLDALTGLATRALFQTRMEEALGPAGLGAAVLFVDLDRFKVVNDSLGHAAGDALLTEVAARIQSCLRDRDTAARLGGDEFAVLLPGVHDADEAVPVAERILDALRAPFDLLGAETFISSSIGVAFSRPGQHASSVLMVHADLAMYQAKKHGKDRYEVFEPAMQEAFQAHIALEADLRRAVVRHEFELRYQPIVNLQSGDITGVEALIRWLHPERGIVPPMDFIPLAEETGMIVPIGEWVLREATARVAEWNARRTGPPLTVSVNLSAVQLDQANLVETVESALAGAGLPAEHLVLEMTESLLVDHRPATLERLEALKALGLRLAIDDFGTGYSSLAYLRRFPVDIIKIDKSFVDDVVDEPTAAALTHGIIQLGRALQLSTVAEGIEHAGQLTSLAGGNCEMGQGYYFAEPLTGTALAELLFPA